jgi:hypothetical protein
MVWAWRAVFARKKSYLPAKALAGPNLKNIPSEFWMTFAEVLARLGPAFLKHLFRKQRYNFKNILFAERFIP